MSFQEDERVNVVTSILEEMTDRFWVICEKDGQMVIIGHNPDDMVSGLLENLYASVGYPPKKKYLNDRFDQIGWDHFSWN